MTAARSAAERDGAQTTASSEVRCDGGERADGPRQSAALRADGGGLDDQSGRSLGSVFDPEEFRRRNASAVAIDVLYLFATAFFTTLAVRGFWPAVFAALPLVLLVYFAWRSTTAFLIAQVLVIALTVVATFAGVLPL